MSIINNVLKDLENKPSSFAPLDIAEFSTEYENKSNSNKLRYVGLFIFLIVIVGVFLIYINSSSMNLRVTAPIPIAVNKNIGMIEPTSSLKEINNRVNVKAQANGVLRNEIIGLQINETPLYFELDFQLSNKVQSFLKQKTGNRYVFQLKDLLGNIEAPLLSRNPWLKNINFNTLPNGVEIQFDTRPGVLVETLEKQNESDFHWIIKLKKSIVESKEIVPPVKKITAKKTKSIDKKIEFAAEKEIGKEVRPPVKQVRVEISPVSNELSDADKFKRVLSSYKNERWGEAEKGFEKLIGSKEDKQVRVYLLNLYKRQQRGLEQEKLLSQSLELYPNDLDFQLIEANHLFSTRQYQQLVTKFGHYDQNKGMLNLLSASYQRIDRHDMAIDHYLKALKIDPQQSKFWVSLAISQQHEGQLSNALSSFRMAERSGKLNHRLKAFVQKQIRQLSK